MLKIAVSFTRALTAIATPALALSSAFSGVAVGADFSAADALFAARDQGSAKIAEARAAYLGALSGATKEETLYALEQVGRLDYFEGIKLEESKSEEKKTVFTRCMDTMDAYLSPAKVGPTVEYFYWKGGCLALWGKATGPTSPASLARVPELLGLIKDGLAASPTYEGGGLYRLGAAVYLKIPALFGGGADKANEYADKAIASEAHAGAAHPETATGSYFFNVYEYKAEALAAKGNKAEAAAVLNDAIARLDGGDLPVGREPEAAVWRRDLGLTLQRIQ